MKGQAKRLVDHAGRAYRTQPTRDGDGDVGFLGLWRHASAGERLATLLAVLLACAASCGVLAAVLLYGELTALFVARHTAQSSSGYVTLLAWFGGGRLLPEGNRTLHMAALIEDSVAFALASAAVMLVQFSAAAASVALAQAAAARGARRLRARLLRQVLRQEPAFFDTNTTMNFATALTEDVEAWRAGAGEHVALAAYLLGTVACGAALALWRGWRLALAGLAVLPVAALGAALAAKKQTQHAAAEVAAQGAAGRVVQQALRHVRTVRAFGGEAHELHRYSLALAPARRAAARRGAWAGGGAALGWLLAYSINAVVFAYGAALCARDMPLPPEQQEYHPGVMVTVLMCTFMAAQNIAMCHPHLEVLSGARGAARSLYALLERRARVDALDESGAKPERFRGDIEFDNVYFNYPSRPDVKVLRGLSLSVRAGETVALVGPSGCGKSTLLQLLQRLYEPDSGAVRVDGRPLGELNLNHFRRSIGVVGQEPVLFSGTVRDNIALGAPHAASRADLQAAAETAHAHQFISRLADGYDTMLGAGGASLSGGQKQRVAIARALLRRPALLLLDEPTSALDPRAERLVQAALDAAASAARTTLLVSHRLSTIVNASRIVYIEQGAVLEQGMHQELLAQQGAYWRLVQEDLTNRSIAHTLSTNTSTETDAEEEPSPEGEGEGGGVAASPLQRASRASLARASATRGSRRLGSACSAHVPLAARALAEPEPDLEPEEPLLEEPAAPRAPALALLRLCGAERWLLAGGAAAALLVGCSMPAFAWLFSKVYGMFSTSDPDEVLRQSALYAGLFGVVALMCGAATFLQALLFQRAGARLTTRLREHTFSNFLAQDQGWFDEPTNSVGALCARLATDCAAVQGATGTRLGTVLQGVSTMALGAALAFAYSWKMTLVSLLSVPCVMGGIVAEGAVARRSEARERRAMEAAARVSTEAVLHVRTVQSLGAERALLARYDLALCAAARSARAARLARAPVHGLCVCAPTLGYAVSLAYGGYLVAAEGLPYEYAILVSEALIYGAWMLAEALSFAPSFAAAQRSGARILAALRRRPAVSSHGAAAAEPGWTATGAVQFKSVSFRYPTRAAPVLRGLSLEARAGETVALVGPSGCGKSTLLQLLLRSYDPDDGTVELDGRDVRRALPLPALRAQLGLVAQEPALFARSLRDNIAYGDNSRDVPLEEVVAAAKQANVHQFIMGLPLGYDTVLGAGGGSLSGGQKQRVAIARALLRNPRVLLLDEATSALDAASEKGVQAALEAAARGRTTLLIAHRLATVQHAHLICLIDDGVVVESGSHAQLVRRRGRYWQMLQQQAPAPAPEAP